MSRFLIVVPPLAGHINPTLAVGAELQRRGHDVAWVGHPRFVTPMLPAGCRLFPAGESWGQDVDAARPPWTGLRGMAALKVLWEDVLIPLGYSMVDGVEAAVDNFGPDAAIVDQQALAGAVVARRRALPWATSASTFSELTRPYAATPKVEAWVSGLMQGLLRDCGEGPEEAQQGDLRFSDQLILVFSVPELVGPVEVPYSPVFVGPAAGPRPPVPDGFPWEWLDKGGPGQRRQRILVSLGTHSADAGSRFYRVLVEAVAAMGDNLQVILVAPSSEVGPVPPNVLTRDFVPQLDLLPEVDAVVCHGGHNTVSESLANGLPLVVAPIRDDQSIVASRVGAVGAGIQVRFARVQAPELGAALVGVLTDPRYRAAAARLGAAFAAAGGAAAAADHLEKLVP
jgi:UDP:flavonoid glycosyltransferase YjiC (YdhE family)